MDNTMDIFMDIDSDNIEHAVLDSDSMEGDSQTFSVITSEDSNAKCESNECIDNGDSTRKIENLLELMERYKPTIPDSVTDSYLRRSGIETSDPRILRLVSLAAQKFISEISNDALSQCKIRTYNPNLKTKPKDRRYLLSMEDLNPVLAEHGVTVRKPPYFV